MFGVMVVLLAALVYRAYFPAAVSAVNNIVRAAETSKESLDRVLKAYTPISALEVGRRNTVAEKLACFCKPKDLVKYALQHILQHGEVDPIQFCAAHLDIQGRETDLHEVIRDGLSLGLLKSTGQCVTVNPELKEALTFHLLGD